MPGVGIAEDALQPTAGTEPRNGEHGGERLRVFHGISWANAARSLPQISDKTPLCPNPRRAAELGRFKFAHLSIPICAEPLFCCKDPNLVALLELGLLTTPCHFLRLFDLLGRHV